MNKRVFKYLIYCNILKIEYRISRFYYYRILDFRINLNNTVMIFNL